MRLVETILSDGLLTAVTVVKTTEKRYKEFSASTALKFVFNQGFQLDNKIFVRGSLVSWQEFRLFLQDVSNGQFHATVEPSEQKRSVADDTGQLPITWNEARWFCGWLSTQAEIAPDKGTYHYRLPTEAEWQEVSPAPFAKTESKWDLQPFTQSADILGSTLCIVREQVNPRYGNLINYLANARWKEADKETAKVMLEVANRTEQGYLNLDDIKTFPYEDLQLIDHLWLKFSGGHFGFSVQKEIYLKCGGKADYKYYGKAYEKFEVEVGWCEGDSWKFRMRYDLAQSPEGHLPTYVRKEFFDVGVGGGLKIWREAPALSLFSRIQACEL